MSTDDREALNCEKDEYPDLICRDCRHVFTAEKDYGTCPNCGSWDTTTEEN